MLKLKENKIVFKLTATFVAICIMLVSFPNIHRVVFASGEPANEISSDIIEMLGEDKVFMTTNGKFFSNGQKKNYTDYGKVSYFENEVVMADINVLNHAYGTSINPTNGEITVNGIKIIVTTNDGASFVPVEDFAKALGMYVYSGDNREFVLTSNQNRCYSNNQLAWFNQEDIDKIWRYMQFDRPDGNTLLSDVKEIYQSREKAHPRLFFTYDEIPLIKSRISASTILSERKEELFDLCDKYLAIDPVTPELVGARLFGSCYEVKDRLINLCTAYTLCDDAEKKSEYAERAWEEMDSACNWNPIKEPYSYNTGWNIHQHFLDAGEIGTGIAFAYDVLYDYLTVEQRLSIRERVYDLFLEFCEKNVYDPDAQYIYRGMQSKHIQSNWGAVTGTAMIMTCLSFMDEEAGTEANEAYGFIASNAMQTLEHIVTLSGPEGTWSEGMGYWEYVMQHLGWSMLSLTNAAGTNYNFLSAKGFDKIAEYGVYNNTRISSFNKGSTTREPREFAPEALIYAKLFNDPARMRFYNEFREIVDVTSFGAEYLLFYDPTFESDDMPSDLPLDRYFSTNGNTVMRSSWENPYGVYVGVSGGWTSKNDSQYDKGSFVYEALGERWSIDLGRSGSTKMKYLGRCESHSALVINPTSDGSGQSADYPAFASFETKHSAAKTVYDLSGVYSDDVESYRRGFFFGDNRNTLVVRDELKLKKESELVWNMVTRAEIEILSDGKSAILTQGGKKLLVTANTSKNNWSFVEISDMAPTGGWRDDTDENGNVIFTAEQQKKFSAGVKKLAIKLEAEGDVYIDVKLSPVIDGIDFPQSFNLPMSQWSLPEGELNRNVIVHNIQNGYTVNSSNSLMFNANVDNGFESIKTYADGKLVQTITNEELDAVYDIIIPSAAMIYPGKMKVDIVADYGNSAATYSIEINVCKENDYNELLKLDFKDYSGDLEKITRSTSNLATYSNVVLNGNSMLKVELDRSKSNTEAYIGFKAGASKGDILHYSYDFMADTTNVNFTENGKNHLFRYNSNFFDDTEANIWHENTWYHVDQIVDSVNKVQRICITDSQGIPVAEKRVSLTNEPDLTSYSFRNFFITSSGKGTFYLDNISIGTTDYIAILPDITYSNDTVYLNKIVASKGIDLSNKNVYVAFYSTQEKESQVLCWANEYDAGSLTGVQLQIPENAVRFKLYFFEENLFPYAKWIEYKISKHEE